MLHLQGKFDLASSLCLLKTRTKTIAAVGTFLPAGMPHREQALPSQLGSDLQGRALFLKISA